MYHRSAEYLMRRALGSTSANRKPRVVEPSDRVDPAQLFLDGLYPVLDAPGRFGSFFRSDVRMRTTITPTAEIPDNNRK